MRRGAMTVDFWHDMAVTYSNLQWLWPPELDLHKIKSVKLPAYIMQGPLVYHP